MYVDIDLQKEESHWQPLLPPNNKQNVNTKEDVNDNNEENTNNNHVIQQKIIEIIKDFQVANPSFILLQDILNGTLIF